MYNYCLLVETFYLGSKWHPFHIFLVKCTKSSTSKTITYNASQHNFLLLLCV